MLVSRIFAIPKLVLRLLLRVLPKQKQTQKCYGIRNCFFAMEVTTAESLCFHPKDGLLSEKLVDPHSEEANQSAMASFDCTSILPVQLTIVERLSGPSRCLKQTLSGMMIQTSTSSTLAALELRPIQSTFLGINSILPIASLYQRLPLYWFLCLSDSFHPRDTRGSLCQSRSFAKIRD